MFKRLFIAIKIDPTEEMLRRIHYFKRNLEEENIHWIKTGHFHMTLKFLGKTPTSQIEQLSKGLREVAMKFPCFEMRVDGIGLFGSQYNPRVIWVGLEPKDFLLSLHEKVIKQLASMGLESDRQNFVPHLTLARIRKIYHKDHFNKVMEKSEQGLIQSQKVNKIVLYESVLLSRGAEYEIIEEFPLSN